ncbi:MAG: ribonuclease Y [Candidatus Brocadiia bacterium]|nr:MAG: ribonuclease Y [Candidatus Brocadiia bacterium]
MYIISFSVGSLILGALGAYLLQNAHLRRNKSAASDLLARAQQEVEKHKKEQLIQFRKEMQRKRSKFNEEFKMKESQISKNESRLVSHEKELRRLENNLKYKDSRFAQKLQQLSQKEELLSEKHRKLDTVVDEQNQKLESLAGISVDEAKKQLMSNLENRVKLEASQLAKDIKDEARLNAQREAKEIIAGAIENIASDFTMEYTLSTVQLPNERFKGMIIGREGRNIRAFEDATGMKVIVDDTPEMIVLSGFDPVRREVARLAMESLIKSKNINPNLIEQAIAKATKEVDRSIIKTADDILNELSIRGVHHKIKEALGRLRFRYSYGQNMLQHSREVALLTGGMAAELGFNVKLAKRAGLLHDIGKALTINSEGSHVQLGKELCERYKEHEVVINAILAHHEEAEPISPISVLVTAADKISGSRPGARRDSLEAYTKRITGLEDIANSFEGVSKTYAISAGREVRVIVEPEKMDDKSAGILSSDIAAKIKEEMEYPGQIKVCVIRQTIVSKVTDEFEEIELNDETVN